MPAAPARERAAPARADPRPPGLLIVGNFLSQHTATRGVCEDLAERLRDAGLEVVTASARRHPLARLADMLATAGRSRHRYRVAQVDVYSGRSFRWAELVCARLRQLAKPYVLTLHGGNLPEFGQRAPRRLARLLGRAAAVTAPSGYLVEAMRPFRADVELIPNGIDCQRYRFRRRDTVLPKLVWLRAFHHIYNPSLALRVLAGVLRSSPGATLTMIGPDKGDGSLEATRRLAIDLGLSERVVFCGGVPKSEVPSWLDRHDLFLNTSNTDNAPVSVVEPLACGLAVTSTRVGGIGHLLVDGEDSLLVPPDDAPAMAAALRRLLEEPGLASRLARAGRVKAESHDWSRLVPRWVALLTRVATGASG